MIYQGIAFAVVVASDSPDQLVVPMVKYGHRHPVQGVVLPRSWAQGLKAVEYDYKPPHEENSIAAY